MGFLLTPRGILPGKDKSDAIRSFQPPRTIKQVREFVGICNYFRASVPNFSKISFPLTQLTSNNSRWAKGEMPPRSMTAFRELKAALHNPPVLAYPDPDLKYHLIVELYQESAGTPGGLGASLVQINDEGIPHTLGFASRGLSKHIWEKCKPFALELIIFTYI